ncbi:MAG: cation transporter [Lachnospiraceae bacterium]|nr:cation transporter [Lachnospiraceae bacterium]MBP3578172.1 cation transporter [Lachnospiraceae bacterium]
MKKTYLLEDLCCANCANKIETQIKELDGVISASLNFIAQKLFVEFEDRIVDTITASVVKTAIKVEPDVTVEEM